MVVSHHVGVGTKKQMLFTTELSPESLLHQYKSQPSSREAEIEGLWRIWGQPELERKTLFQKIHPSEMIFMSLLKTKTKQKKTKQNKTKTLFHYLAKNEKTFVPVLELMQ